MNCFVVKELVICIADASQHLLVSRNCLSALLPFAFLSHCCLLLSVVSRLVTVLERLAHACRNISLFLLSTRIHAALVAGADFMIMSVHWSV